MIVDGAAVRRVLALFKKAYRQHLGDAAGPSSPAVVKTLRVLDRVSWVEMPWKGVSETRMLYGTWKEER